MGNVKFIPGALDHLLNQPSGDVGGHMRKIGVEILAGAHVMAGMHTGDIRRKLYMKQGRRGKTQYVEVGSKSRHAYYHHEGTKPHMILPGFGRLLRFNVGGHWVYAQKVRHPGTRANPYLTTPMKRAVRG